MLYAHGTCRSLAEALQWAGVARNTDLRGAYPASCVVLEAYALDLYAALNELVKLKDLKEQIGAHNTEAEDEYERRKPGAWARGAARA
jgi:hypothetical protein